MLSQSRHGFCAGFSYYFIPWLTLCSIRRGDLPGGFVVTSRYWSLRVHQLDAAEFKHKDVVWSRCPRFLSRPGKTLPEAGLYFSGQRIRSRLRPRQSCFYSYTYGMCILRYSLIRRCNLQFECQKNRKCWSCRWVTSYLILDLWLTY